MERWKEIQGYEGLYEVSDKGRVKSLERIVKYSNSDKTHTVKAKILKSCKKENKYLIVGLNKDGVRRNKYVHRLVAQAFILNPENKPTVNHIDCNPLNNNVENLEWATYKEQEEHKYSINRNVLTHRRIVVVNYLDGSTSEHPSITQCAKDLGIHRDTVYNILNNEKSKKKSELNIKSILYKEA